MIILLIYEPPIWYTRLKQVHKNLIKEIIGGSTSSSKTLEDEIMDNTGTTRSDVKKLLDWWFSSNVTTFFSLNTRMHVRCYSCKLDFHREYNEHFQNV